VKNKTLVKSNKWFSRKNAFNYLNNKESKVRISTVLDIVKKICGGGVSRIKLLDIGSGDGFITNKMKDCGFEVYSIDSSELNVNKCKKMGINSVRGDVENKLPYKDDYFDYVFAGEIIEHIIDTKSFMKELNRVIKIGGKLLITTPNLAHIPERFRLLRGLNPSQVTPIHEFLHLHVRPFTMNTLKFALETNGFAVISVASTMVVFKWDGEEVVFGSKFLARMRPTWGNTLIVESVKVR
jgi:2-polyprenyl-3-methyl-5-hydroxy-6-metoxy-1,4-benzoquinol methylase